MGPSHLAGRHSGQRADPASGQGLNPCSQLCRRPLADHSNLATAFASAASVKRPRPLRFAQSASRSRCARPLAATRPFRSSATRFATALGVYAGRSLRGAARGASGQRPTRRHQGAGVGAAIPVVTTQPRTEVVIDAFGAGDETPARLPDGLLRGGWFVARAARALCLRASETLLDLRHQCVVGDDAGVRVRAGPMSVTCAFASEPESTSLRRPGDDSAWPASLASRPGSRSSSGLPFAPPKTQSVQTGLARRPA